MACFAVSSLLAAAQSAPRSPSPRRLTEAAPDDAASFMERVLANRRINWAEAQGYVFHETESLEVKGLDIADLQGFHREYLWIVRDEYLVRSPVSVNGAPVSERDRRREEEKWLRRSEDGKRLEREAFFDFDFKKGDFLFAGYTAFEGIRAAAIEFYPRHLFSDEMDDDEDRRFGELFDKTSLVTLLVKPDEHQILRMTFQNVGLEFLPYRWLVRIDDLQASMTMGQPIDGVWLPRDIEASGKISTAAFQVAVVYNRKFFDYKQIDVKVKLRFEKPDVPDKK